MPTTWQTIRVFISSTFRDMHAERDHLVKRVFPALRERFQKYRIHLVDVDLRWGITEEESEKDQVLDLCLQQIDECRPFFVGILGQRYGWVPTTFTEEAANKYGWVQYHTGKSVTELEIVHGVLNDPEMHGHGMFFFRDPRLHRPGPRTKTRRLPPRTPSTLRRPNPRRQTRHPETDHPRHPAPLPTLRWLPLPLRRLPHQLATRQPRPARPGRLGSPPPDRRRRNRHPRTNTTRSTTTSANSSTASASSTLPASNNSASASPTSCGKPSKQSTTCPTHPPTATLAESDPLAEEAAYHEDFIESRLRVYVGRQQVQDQLTAYAEGDATHPCLVTGPSGSGKSAALARFAKTYTDTHPDTLLIPHFIGASPGSTSLRQVLRRFCLEFQQRFGPAEEVPADMNGLVSRFRQALDGVPADARVVLVLDAVNQFNETDNAHSMFWLPRELPPQVRVVVSCIDDTPESSRHAPCAFRSATDSAPTPTTDPIIQSLAPRPLERLKIKPLSNDERLQIVSRVPSLSAKKLDPKQIDLLLSNPATETPLFLLVALEELRGFGSYEQVADRIAAFPHDAADPVAALFAQVIERLRQEFDADVVRTILALIATSRSGMSEPELLEMVEEIDVEQSTGDLYPILRQLRPYLQHRGELLDFFHRGLYKAVRQWYLPEDDDAQPYHQELAEYFHAKLNPPDAEPWTGNYPAPSRNSPTTRRKPVCGTNWKPPSNHSHFWKRRTRRA